MNINEHLWEEGFSQFLFTEKKLSTKNQGDIALKSRFKLFWNFFSNKPFDKQNFNLLVYDMKERNLSHAYINNIIKLAKHLHEYLLEYHKYDSGIGNYTYFKQQRVLYDLFTPDELKSIYNLNVAYHREEEINNLRYQGIFRLLAQTGIRLQEACNLTWDCVTSDSIQIKNPKNGVDRIIPITSVMHCILNSQPHVSEYVFTSRLKGKCDKTSINADLKKRMNILNIKRKASCHTIRHVFATDLMRNGAEYNEVRALLGHEDISSTVRYVHYLIDNLRVTLQTYSSYQKQDLTFTTVKSKVKEYIEKLIGDRFKLEIREERGKIELCLEE